MRRILLSISALLLTFSAAWAQYCTPTYNSQCTSADFINNVTFATISNLNTGCGAPSASNYINYSSTFTANVTPGASYNLTVAPGPTWGQYFVAFIDTNLDGDFADAGEFFNLGYLAGGATGTYPITIPAGASNGQSRLRVMCRYGTGALTQADVCVTGLSFGEVEDYGLIIGPPPTCPAATAVTAGTVTSGGATISWTNGSGSIASTLIEYGPAGFTPGTGTVVNNVTSPYVLTGLNPATNYTVYVRHACTGGNGNSFYAGPAAFTTLCATFVAPFLQTFGAPPTAPGLPNCWTNNTASTTQIWRFANGTGNPATDPDYAVENVTDHTTGTGFFAWYDGSYPTNNIALTTPNIDITPLSQPYFSYFVYSYNTNDAARNILTAQAWNGTSWITLGNFSGSFNGWQEIGYSLVGLGLPSVTQFRIVFNQTTSGGSAFYNDMLVDDVRVGEAPACPAPSGLTLVSTGAFSATLSWTSGNGVNLAGATIEYGAPGFTPGTGTQVAVTGTSPFTVTGLSPSTTYSFYIFENCGVDGNSYYSSPTSGATACVPVVAPYLMTFGAPPAAPNFPNCWANSTTVATDQWKIANGTGNPAADPDYAVENVTDHTTGSGFFAWIDGSYTTANRAMVSPLIDISNLNVPYFDFWIYSYNTNDVARNSVTAQVFNGTQWVTLGTYTGNNNNWVLVEYDLSTLTLPNIIQLRLVWNPTAVGGTAFYNDILVDDFRVGEAPTCRRPNNIAAINVTDFTAQVSFSAIPNGVSYTIEWGPAGFTPGTGTTAVTTTSPYTITGLTPVTNYAFYITTNCGPVDGLSGIAGPTTFTTECTPFPTLGNSINTPIVVNSLPYFNGGSTQTCFTSTSTLRPSVDVFYEFTTGPCAISADVSLCGSSFDTWLYVIDANGNVIADNDDFCGAQSVVTFNVTANTTYYAVIEAFTAVTGLYQIAITETVSAGISNVSFATTNPSCTGASDGIAQVNVTGGIPPYTIIWDDVDTAQTRNDLSAGTYVVRVFDNCGGMVLSQVTLSTAQLPRAEATANNVDVINTCAGVQTGLGSFNVQPGMTYSWSPATGLDDATSPTPVATPTVTTTYFLTVADTCGNTSIDSVTIAVNAAPVLATAAANISCATANNGAIDITVSSEVTPFAFTWSNGSTTEDLSNLSPGTYALTVTDGCGQTSTTSATILEPATLASTVGTITPTSCSADADGAIDITVTGGTTPYSYAWSNGGTLEDNANLAASTYSVVVTDANGCTAELTNLVVTAPNGLTVNIDNSQGASCAGGSDGAIAVTVSGGTAPYTFQWNTGSTDEDLTGLGAASYIGIITDANGCQIATPVIALTNPSAVSASASSTGVTAAGNDGTATATGNGGVAPYTYLWSNGSTDVTATGLAAGVYNVTITDANGCTATAFTTVGIFSGVSNIDGLLAMELFPNPTNGAALLEVRFAAPVSQLQVELFNILGQRVFVTQLDNVQDQQINLDLNGFQSGTYLVKVQANGQITSLPLILVK